jgi:hypothetical protein
MEGNMTRGRRKGNLANYVKKLMANNGQRGWRFENKGI